MVFSPRAIRRLALCLPLFLLGPQALDAQEPAPAKPAHLTPANETPWIYVGSDVPRDKEWIFGRLPNGVRYAVRRNGVPPGQVSIRARIDAGSLHEQPTELGFAHLLEHLVFRESRYLGPAQAIPTWQRLGATFGSDTNAETTPTHTVLKLDLPNADANKVAESMKLLSGMVRGPVLTDANVRAEVPIILAEKRERGGAQQRAADASRAALFSGQKLATQVPIGTAETLEAATGASVAAFHQRWYRPENTVIVAIGDIEPAQLAAEIERWFGDWKPAGKPVPAPDFGDPVAPPGSDPANPIGALAAIVEPGLPRSFTYAVLRPWRPVNDTIEYNRGLLIDSLAQALINRRLEARARAGGKYLFAQVGQDDISRSADATFVSFAPLDGDWRSALGDVRAVIADALANPPSREEIDRELAEFEVVFKSSVEQRRVMAGANLADDLVNAVDIRETVAAPETVLTVFDLMRKSVTPAEVMAHTKALFTGSVIRGAYVTPEAGEADKDALFAALKAPVAAATDARLAAATVNFADLPPIGKPGAIVAQKPLGVLDIEQVDFANGVKAVLWANEAEPGRVAVRVRFGAGYRAFGPQDAAYIKLGEAALVSSGLGSLGQEELDRISTGRKMGFDFKIEPGAFTFTAQTRAADLADQLYLFAAKLAMPRWDTAPVTRAAAASRLAYDAYAASPSGVLNRDLPWLLSGKDPRFATADGAALAAADPAQFRKVWEPILSQGPVEIFIFGDFRSEAAIEALKATFGALPPRTALAPEVAGRATGFATPGPTTVLHHTGDADQAAAVVAWPSGAGVAGIRESRQLEILTQVFNNRLLDAMRERAGASYAPVVRSEWPTDVTSGGRISALAQLRPADVPAFVEAARKIAADLASTPIAPDELQRVTEPLRQYVSRASTGNLFWLYQLEGVTLDPRHAQLLRTLLYDYTETTPEAMQALARKYFAGAQPWSLAVLPQGQTLAGK